MEAKTNIFGEELDMLYDCGAGGSFLGIDSYANILADHPELDLDVVDEEFEMVK